MEIWLNDKDVQTLRSRWTMDVVKASTAHVIFNDLHGIINGLESAIKQRNAAIAATVEAERFAAMLQRQMEAKDESEA